MWKANEANVEGIELISFRALWFIVAGFILGFTASTLWEWLYFRKKRQQMPVRAWKQGGATAISSPESQSIASPRDRDLVHNTRRPQSYRSSGVLLENERLPAASDLPYGSASAQDVPGTNEPRTSLAAQPIAGDSITHTESTTLESTILGAKGEVPPTPLTVAALTAQQDSNREGRATAEECAADTSAPRQFVPTQLGDTPTSLPSTSTRTTNGPHEDVESLGNPAAIARAGALAAASLANRPEASRAVASAVNAGVGEEERVTVDTQEKGQAPSSEPLAPKPSAAEPSAVVRPAPRVATPAEKPGATPVVSQPTRTVTAHGFAQRTPLPEGQGAASPSGQSDHAARTSEPTRQRPTDYPDDLAMIKGIGEAYKRRLYATGIYTWRQLAEADTDSLRRITRAKPNADIGSWLTQALALAEKYGRMGANFTGPLDDFTRIEGVGAITADILYKAGICTYEQLAGASPDALARIVPAPTVGNENDFDGWINEAARLATAKRRNHGILP